MNHFIDCLADFKDDIEGAVSSSEASTQRLKNLGIRVLDLNDVGTLDIYVDGADEVNPHKQLIKGGGAALTREKIIAALEKWNPKQSPMMGPVVFTPNDHDGKRSLYMIQVKGGKWSKASDWIVSK